jgi:2-amino-4-hydroxy-6-hydroxymethyldihydropteridine diphosphokinase
MIFLGLGANLGDKEGSIETAIHVLSSKGLELIAQAPLFYSPPWGFEDQPTFVNTVIRVGFDGDPLALLHICKTIEREMGRRPTIRNGPRIIDIDVLDFHQFPLKHPRLELPHPRLKEREFVIRPWAQLYPQYRIASLDRSVEALLLAL